MQFPLKWLVLPVIFLYLLHLACAADWEGSKALHKQLSNLFSLQPAWSFPMPTSLFPCIYNNSEFYNMSWHTEIYCFVWGKYLATFYLYQEYCY